MLWPEGVVTILLTDGSNRRWFAEGRGKAVDRAFTEIIDTVEYSRAEWIAARLKTTNAEPTGADWVARRRRVPWKLGLGGLDGSPEKVSMSMFDTQRSDELHRLLDQQERGIPKEISLSWACIAHGGHNRSFLFSDASIRALPTESANPLVPRHGSCQPSRRVSET